MGAGAGMGPRPKKLPPHPRIWVERVGKTRKLRVRSYDRGNWSFEV